MDATTLATQTMHTSLGTIDVLDQGGGPPLVVLHRDSGRDDGAEALALLAERFRVVAPSLPGYDRSPRADWMRSATHLAYAALDVVGAVAPDGCVLLGLGFGGWIAAEVAAMAPHLVGALVLHAPMGIRPRAGAFLDQFLIAAEDYVRAGFASDAAFERAFGPELPEETVDRWERNRETTSRLAWAPYMYDPALPHLLARCRRPTLVTWGAQDRIVPRACAESYATLIPAAELVTLPGAGHHAELEAPETFTQTVLAFLDSALGPAQRGRAALMLLTWFTEQPMLSYPEQRALERYPRDHPARRVGDTVLLFSNRYFDAAEGSRLYRLRLLEAQLAEQAGFDAVMTNEHHNAPFCMSARCNIISAAVLTATERIRVLQAGNPLPLWANPVQLAEEIALLDMLSGGRLIAGIVRGGGQEQLANNVNPAFNRELFDEAHDLIVRAWTEPGPFSWDGEHFQLRVVNPWALPLQKPHPRIVVPGVASPETLAWAARHGYPYIALNTPLEQTKQMWRLYAEEAAAVGVEAGPEHRGYLLKCHILPDSQRARRNAEQFNWMRGEFAGVGNLVWNMPAGYSSPEARKARRRHVAAMAQPVAQAIDQGLIFAGTPAEVMPHLHELIEQTRPSILVFWGADGKISHEDTVECIRTIGEEVLPQVREIGRELGLLDPFEADAPVGVGRGPVRIAAPLAPA